MSQNTTIHPPSRKTAVWAITLAVLGAQCTAFAAAYAPVVTASAFTPPGTLTSINQVERTDKGVETWIEVQGSGQCSFTIGSTRVAPQRFESTAATPFPMRIKIPGAPLGSNLWIAKGNGNCKGTAITTFSVNG